MKRTLNDLAAILSLNHFVQMSPTYYIKLIFNLPLRVTGVVIILKTQQTQTQKILTILIL